MLKLKITLNKNKIRQHGAYTLDEVFEHIDNLFQIADITKTEREDCSTMYYGNGDNLDFANFFNVIFHLEEQSWFLSFADDVILYDNSSYTDKTVFAKEDILAQMKSENGKIKYA